MRTLFTPGEYDDLFVLARRFRNEGLANREIADDGWVPAWPTQRPLVERIRQTYETLEQGGGRTLTDPFMGTPIVKCDPTCMRGLCRAARDSIVEYSRRLGLNIGTVRCTGCIDCVMAERDDEVPL